MPGRFNPDDYEGVPERTLRFLEKYPEGSLQSAIVTRDDSHVLMIAYAYRTPDDPRPGIGHAWEPVPGPTRGSEVEICETSARGRALSAIGFLGDKGIATREEMQAAARKSEQPERRGGSPSSPSAASAQYRRGELAELMVEKGLKAEHLTVYANLVGIPKGQRATNEQMDALIDAVRGHGTDEPIEPAVAPPAAEAPVSAGAPPPKPGTDEFRALTSQERLNARAYWAAHPEDEDTLAEQLRVPA